MAKLCSFRSATACGFIEKSLSPCPSCPFRKKQEAGAVATVRGEKGEQGEKGDTGTSGSQGIPGQPGDRGPLGSIGSTGLTGITGDQGPIGFPGPKGDKGDKGEEGTVDEEKLKALVRQFGGRSDSDIIIGWGPRSPRIHTDSSHSDSGDHLLAAGTVVGSTSQAQDFGSTGIKADVIAESTSAAGVTIDSVLLKDGEMGPLADNKAVIFGTGSDATIKYDGTNLIINPDAVGSGGVQIEGVIALGGASVDTSDLINVATSSSTVDAVLGGTFVHTGTATRIEGMDFAVRSDGSGVNQTVVAAGGVASVGNNATGSINTLIAGEFQIARTPGANPMAVDQGYGIRVRTPSWSGGAPTTIYGIRVDDQTDGFSGVTDVFGIYVEDFNGTAPSGILASIYQTGTNGLNYLNANTRIGSTVAPTATLDVTGNAIIDGDTDEVQLTVQAHSTQTGPIMVVEDSAGTTQIEFTKSGINFAGPAFPAVTGTIGRKGTVYIQVAGAGLSFPQGIGVGTGVTNLKFTGPSSGLTDENDNDRIIFNDAGVASSIHFPSANPLTTGDGSVLWQFGTTTAINVTAALGFAFVSNTADPTIVQGGVMSAGWSGTGTAATVLGMEMFANLSGTATVTELIGSQSLVKIGGAGTVTESVAHKIKSPVFSGAQPTTHAGLRVENQGVSGITTSYGIIVEDQTGSTTNVALSLGAGDVGFYGVTPVVRAGAYTQTFSTADKTHANPTATAVGDLVATNGGWGYSTEANADKVHTAIDALIVDVADVKQLVNSIIDDLQAYGLFQ
ncbi:hypothetical protein LCGC14_0887690 [marine sediment metagenome]|uniref:Uncharacterized protein n=1 Tax=marine sediment metagenome TaxID=412755 RepID=A0A0F9P055_9ZZZZ